jgi:hypothetical protein
MKLIPYDEFSRLRMTDFWPAEVNVSPVQGFSCRVGYGDGDSCGYSYFLKDRNRRNEVAEIRLEWLGPEEPLKGSDVRLFAHLGLPLAAGMTEEQVRLQLGEPIERNQVALDEAAHLVFLCGESWLYYVFCMVWPGQGLRAVHIVRKDAYDRELARQAETDEEDDVNGKENGSGTVSPGNGPT